MLWVAWDMTTLPDINNSVASILDTKVTGDLQRDLFSGICTGNPQILNLAP